MSLGTEKGDSGRLYLGNVGGMDDATRLVDAARRLSETLTPGDLDHVLHRITKAAVEVLPHVDLASITVQEPDGRLVTVAPTDSKLLALDEAQHQLGEGPWFDPEAQDVQVTARDLTDEGRFPAYAEKAVALDIRSQAAMRLFDAPDSRAVLNLYSQAAGAFDDLGALAELFNDQSMMAIDYAREIDDRAKAAELRVLVGNAVGAAMERYELTHTQAFAFLTRLAQRQSVSLPEAARVIVEAAEERAGD